MPTTIFELARGFVSAISYFLVQCDCISTSIDLSVFMSSLGFPNRRIPTLQLFPSRACTSRPNCPNLSRRWANPVSSRASVSTSGWSCGGGCGVARSLRLRWSDRLLPCSALSLDRPTGMCDLRRPRFVPDLLRVIYTARMIVADLVARGVDYRSPMAIYYRNVWRFRKI